MNLLQRWSAPSVLAVCERPKLSPMSKFTSQLISVLSLLNGQPLPVVFSWCWCHYYPKLTSDAGDYGVTEVGTSCPVSTTLLPRITHDCSSLTGCINSLKVSYQTAG